MKRSILVVLALLLGGMGRATAGPLVARYVFDGNAVDVSGNGNDGTIFGGPSFVQGESGQAIFFNNPSGQSTANQYVQLPNTQSILGLNDSSFTFAIRFQSTDTAQNNGRLFGGRDGSGAGFVFDYSAAATPEAYGALFGADAMVLYGHGSGLVDPMAVTTDGSWHWAVVVLDRSVQRIDYYVDAHLVESKTYTQLGALSFANQSVGRVNGPLGTDLDFGARLTAVDDVRLYNTALGQDEVLQLESVNPVPEPAAVILFGTGLVGMVGYVWRSKRPADGAARLEPVSC